MNKKSDQTGVKRQAVAVFGQAITLGCNDPDVYKVRGETLAEIGETQLAIHDLNQAAQLYKLRDQEFEHKSVLREIEELEKQHKH